MSDKETTGLRSAGVDGLFTNVCGTSLAAPLVSRTLAELDVRTAQARAPRTLRALMLHNADLPKVLQARGLREIGRQLAGFGRPAAAASMLEFDDHQITLVFESQLTAGTTKPAIMRFAFSWPDVLVDQATGACTGKVRMTLVYDPPLDPAFGAEFARVNLDASLKQRQPVNRKDGKPSFSDQTSMLGLPKTANMGLSERALIDHGLKWWPTKKYQANLSDNGTSPEWRLEVTSLTRAESTFPADGVPFSVVLTIEDPDGKKPLFQTFRRYLQTRNVQVDDIRTAQRLRARQ
jgi:hypothetical protein